MKWSDSLKKGMKIDALKEERIFGEFLRAWAVATISEMFGDVMYCDFDGIPDNTKY